MKNKLFLISKMTTIILVILFGIVLTFRPILLENAAAVNAFLGAETQKIIEDPDAENRDSLYFKTEFESVAALKAEGMKLVEEVMGEGAVLLANGGEEPVLPLEKGAKVNLYSISSVDPVYSGAGSSGSVAAGRVDFKTALERSGVGLSVNADLWNWYNSNRSSYGRTSNQSVNVTFHINEAPWEVLPEAKNSEAAAGIFVLSRSGSEAQDVVTVQGDRSDMTNGNYLELSPAEISVLKGMKALKDSGKLSAVIVLMNAANQVQTDFMDDPEYGVDALLWCGMLGSSGANAVADLLVGNIVPSGKLSDTFWKEHRFNPVYANFGSYSFSNNDTPYVVYQEGIYNGYRYTETRYEDKVLGRDKVGEFDYGSAVSYPFGYGLSYTEFSYSDFSVAPVEGTDRYTVSVKVTNTGETYSGKEAVQIYLQKPYTDYDVQNHIEKASVELVGYAKTKALAPGASEVLTVEVEGKSFASYDAYGEGTYIVDAGTYYLTAAKDAHAAIDNILAAKGKTTADGMTEEGDASAVGTVQKEFDAQTYSATTYAMENGLKESETDIVNRFDNADLNRYAGADGQKVDYITRSDWAGTVKFGIDGSGNALQNEVKLRATEQMLAEIDERMYDPKPDDVAYPTYGAHASAGDEGHLDLIDLRAVYDGDNDLANDVPIAYNDPLWDDLLDQLSWDETVSLLSVGFRLTGKVASVNKPYTIDHNGSVGVNQPYGAGGSSNRGYAKSLNDPDKNEVPVMYPSNGIVASTFNSELIRRYGEQWGEDGLWAGYAGLYGPGCNTHRGAHGGRAFEYYSEDPFLGGTMCARVVGGLKEKGIYSYLKHAILNDQENDRAKICTFANEQTIREIYLKQFEIAIVEGGAANVMTGYNRIGATWTGMQGFCNTVLRDEFGMTGFAVTDYLEGTQYRRMPGAILAGNDLPDQDYGSTRLYDGYKTGYGEFAWAMRESAHRILYTVVQSAAMNGIAAGTRIIPVTPVWMQYLDGIVIYISILTGGSIIMLLCSIFGKRRRAQLDMPDGGQKGGASSDGSAESSAPAASDPVQAPQKEPERKEPEKGSANRAKKRSALKNGIIAAETTLLALIILGNAIFLPIYINSKSGPSPEGGTPEPPPVTVPDETAGGTGVVSHVFEAEAAEFVGYTSDGIAAAYCNKTHGTNGCVTSSYVIAEGFSGGIALRRLKTPAAPFETEGPNTLTFRFTSDKAVKVNMDLRLASDGQLGYSLSEAYTVTVNGENVSDENDVRIPDHTGTESAFGGYFYMHTVSVPIELKEGENVIVFSAEAKAANFDYIDVKTSANLTGWTNHYWQNENLKFTVDSTPTEHQGGRVTLSDDERSESFDIPAIGSSMYTTRDVEGTTCYFIGNSDFCVWDGTEIDPTQPVKLSLGSNPNAGVQGTVSHWNERSDKGDIDGDPCRTYVLGGDKDAVFRELTTYSVDASIKYEITYTVKNFGDKAMKLRIGIGNTGYAPGTQSNGTPAYSDIELNPGDQTKFSFRFTGWTNTNIITMFIFTEEIPENDPITFGLTAYIRQVAADDPDPQPVPTPTTDPEPQEEWGEKMTFGVSSAATAAEHSDKAGVTKQENGKIGNEDCYVYTYWGAENEKFRMLTAVSGGVLAENTYKMTYVIKNLGESTIHFLVFNTNSGYAEKDDYKHEVTLEAGESEVFTIEFTNLPNDGNFITLFKIKEAVSKDTPAKFGINAYLVVEEPKADERGTKLNFGTSSDGSAALNSQKAGISKNEGTVEIEGEACPEYSYWGAVNEKFRIFTGADGGVDAGAYTITYTIKNTGTTAIKLTVYQINSQFNTTNFKYDLELAAGESKTFTISFSGLTNTSNYITLFEIKEAVDQSSPATFAVLAYIKES